MIYTTNDLLNKYKDYSNPKTKINRLVSKGQLFSLAKGIYTDDKNLNALVVSSILSNPSYVSYEKALEYYGLIPERVYTITCATYTKHKDKKVSNHFGNFYYSDVAKAAYSYGIVMKQINNHTVYIATPEKALCDLLYKLPPVKSVVQLKKILFNNLRIDKNEFNKLNKEDIKYLSSIYHCTSIKYLNKLMESKYE